jgi:predicted N-acetyltransferase YhbS
MSSLMKGLRWELLLRRAVAEDMRAIERLTRLAFWNLHGPGCDEHYLVHAMRRHPDFMESLEWVAEVAGEVVGHIAYSRAKVVSDAGQVHEVLCFGPVSVSPDYQAGGVGRTLITHTLELAAGEAKYPAVLIYGDPAYYSLLGFVKAEVFDIGSADNYYADPLQAYPLWEGALEGISGRFVESSAFEMDPEAAQAFEMAFAAEEPLVKVEGTQSQIRFQELIKLRRPRG